MYVLFAAHITLFFVFQAVIVNMAKVYESPGI